MHPFAVSLTALPAVLKDNESRLSDWPSYPRAYERASAELTPVSWFPPGEPVVVLSPRLNCVWTLLKHYKITQHSLKCERGPKTFIPSLPPSLFKCHHHASTYTADSTDQNVQNAEERLLSLLQIQNTSLIFSLLLTASAAASLNANKILLFYILLCVVLIGRVPWTWRKSGQSPISLITLLHNSRHERLFTAALIGVKHKRSCFFFEPVRSTVRSTLVAFLMHIQP